MVEPSRSQASRTVISPRAQTSAITSRSREPRLRSRKSRDDLKPQNRNRRMRACRYYKTRSKSAFDFRRLEALERPTVVQQYALDHRVTLKGRHGVVEAFDSHARRIPWGVDAQLVSGVVAGETELAQHAVGLADERPSKHT